MRCDGQRWERDGEESERAGIYICELQWRRNRMARGFETAQIWLLCRAGAGVWQEAVAMRQGSRCRLPTSRAPPANSIVIARIFNHYPGASHEHPCCLDKRPRPGHGRVSSHPCAPASSVPRRRNPPPTPPLPPPSPQPLTLYPSTTSNPPISRCSRCTSRTVANP